MAREIFGADYLPYRQEKQMWYQSKFERGLPVSAVLLLLRNAIVDRKEERGLRFLKP